MKSNLRFLPLLLLLLFLLLLVPFNLPLDLLLVSLLLLLLVLPLLSLPLLLLLLFVTLLAARLDLLLLLLLSFLFLLLLLPIAQTSTPEAGQAKGSNSISLSVPEPCSSSSCSSSRSRFFDFEFEPFEFDFEFDVDFEFEFDSDFFLDIFGDCVGGGGLSELLADIFFSFPSVESFCSVCVEFAGEESKDESLEDRLLNIRERGAVTDEDAGAVAFDSFAGGFVFFVDDLECDLDADFEFVGADFAFVDVDVVDGDVDSFDSFDFFVDFLSDVLIGGSALAAELLVFVVDGFDIVVVFSGFLEEGVDVNMDDIDGDEIDKSDCFSRSLNLLRFLFVSLSSLALACHDVCVPTNSFFPFPLLPLPLLLGVEFEFEIAFEFEFEFEIAFELEFEFELEFAFEFELKFAFGRFGSFLSLLGVAVG